MLLALKSWKSSWKLTRSSFLSFFKWHVNNRSFQTTPDLGIKTRLSAQPLIWKWFFILLHIKLIFTRKAVHLASFWKRGFLELGIAYWCLTSTVGSIFGSRWTTRMWFLSNQSFTNSSWQNPALGEEHRCICHLLSGLNCLFSCWWSGFAVAGVVKTKYH